MGCLLLPALPIDPPQVLGLIFAIWEPQSSRHRANPGIRALGLMDFLGDTRMWGRNHRGTPPQGPEGQGNPSKVARLAAADGDLNLRTALSWALTPLPEDPSWAPAPRLHLRCAFGADTAGLPARDLGKGQEWF